MNSFIIARARDQTSLVMVKAPHRWCISFVEGRDFHLKAPVPPSLQVFPWSGGVRGGAPAVPGARPEQSGGGLSLPGQAQ